MLLMMRQELEAMKGAMKKIETEGAMVSSKSEDGLKLGGVEVPRMADDKASVDDRSTVGEGVDDSHVKRDPRRPPESFRKLAKLNLDAVITWMGDVDEFRSTISKYDCFDETRFFVEAKLVDAVSEIIVDYLDLERADRLDLDEMDDFTEAVCEVVRPRLATERVRYLSQIRFACGRDSLFARAVDFGTRFERVRSVLGVSERAAKSLFMKALPRYLRESVDNDIEDMEGTPLREMRRITARIAMQCDEAEQIVDAKMRVEETGGRWRKSSHGSVGLSSPMDVEVCIIRECDHYEITCRK